MLEKPETRALCFVLGCEGCQMLGDAEKLKQFLGLCVLFWVERVVKCLETLKSSSRFWALCFVLG